MQNESKQITVPPFSLRKENVCVVSVCMCAWGVCVGVCVWGCVWGVHVGVCVWCVCRCVGVCLCVYIYIYSM